MLSNLIDHSQQLSFRSFKSVNLCDISVVGVDVMLSVLNAAQMRNWQTCDTVCVFSLCHFEVTKHMVYKIKKKCN